MKKRNQQICGKVGILWAKEPFKSNLYIFALLPDEKFNAKAQKRKEENFLKFGCAKF